MPTQPYPRPFAIRQLCTAGQQFTGAAPGTTPVWASDVYAYPTSATAGLVDPSVISYGGAALRAEVYLRLAGTALMTWSLRKVDSASLETVILSGTTETSVFISDKDGPILLPGETLKLVTVGAAAAQSVQVTLSPLEA